MTTLIPYLEDFDGRLLPPDLRKSVARHIVPELINALAAEGFTAQVTHDLKEAGEIHQAMGEGAVWSDVFKAQLHPEASAANTTAIVIERDGIPVACGVSRLMSFPGTLEEAFASQAFFCGPSTPQQNSSCTVTAPSARAITGPFAYTGAIRVRRTEASKDLVPPLVRLLHIKLLAEWQWDWLVGLALEGVARAYGHKKYGYAAVEMGVWRRANGLNLPFYLLTAPRAYAEQFFLTPAVLDLSHPIGMPVDWETV
jgi:hypothetical protein